MKSISFKNFRNSGDTLTRINLRPVTIFTGCNSAGKSTAAKALLLLNSYLQDVKNNNYNLIDTPLNFSKTVKLGTFNHALNTHAKEKGDETITLGFSVDSFFNDGEIEFYFTFIKKEGDFLGNGWLKSLSVDVDNQSLFTINIVKNHYTLDISNASKLIELFRNYMIGQVAAGYRNNISLQKYEEAQKRKCPNFSKNTSVEYLMPLNFHLILEEEKKLISERAIKKCRYDFEFDQSIANAIYGETLEEAELNLYYLYASVFHYNRLDCIISNIEIERKQKIVKQDIDFIWGKYVVEINKIMSKKSVSTNPKLLSRLNLKLGEANKKKIFDELDKYISSNFCSRAEYLKNCEVNNLARYVYLYNAENEDLDDEMPNKNVLESLNSVYPPSLSKSFMFDSFITKIVNEAINSEFRNSIRYVDASTTEVKRLYSVDDLNGISGLLSEYNHIISTYGEGDSTRSICPGHFINKWLKEFNICEKIDVSNVEGSIQIKLISKEVPKGRPLADYGYGVTQLISLLLNLEIALSEVRVHSVYEIEHQEDIWYGCLVSIPKYLHHWIIIEEPEIHLHPRLQSKLADMFKDAANYGVRIIAETHSEYLVRRSQAIVAELNVDAEKFEKKNPFKVYYFPDHGKPYDMRYKPNGHFEETFGDGFFDEAGKWVRLLSRNNRK